jgi:hypothetical protein
MTAIVKLEKIEIIEAGGDGWSWFDDGDTEWNLNFRVEGQNPPKQWSDGSVHDGDLDETTDDVNPGQDYYWVVNASLGQGISLEAWGEEDDPVFNDTLPIVSTNYHGGNYDDYETTGSNGSFSYTLSWDILFV